MMGWRILAASPPPHLRFGQAPEDVARQVAGQVYVATPYTRRAVRADGGWCPERNMALLSEAADEIRVLAQLGCSAVSPIVLAAAMVSCTGQGSAALDGLDPLDQAFWTRWCAPILAASSAVVVPSLPGWRDSAGIWHEVSEALARNKPVFCYGGAPA